MIVEEKELRERYASLSDDELADIARSADLTDMAKRCLKYEMDDRGLENIDTKIAELDEIDKQLDKHRQKKIHEGKETINKFSKPFYISGTVFCIIGVALYILGSSKEEQLGLGAIGLGAFFVFFAIIKSISRLAILKLIFRK
ncbi:MAG: hypothetical protein ABW130_16150 [Candidatus Thiodiazotropha lotti]